MSLSQTDKEIITTFILPILIYLFWVIFALVKEKCFSFELFLDEALGGIPIFLSLFFVFIVPNIWESGLQLSLKICLYVSYTFLSIVILLLWKENRTDNK